MVEKETQRERQRLHSGRISFLEGVSDAMVTPPRKKKKWKGGDADFDDDWNDRGGFFRPALPEKVIAAERERVTHGEDPSEASFGGGGPVFRLCVE